MGWGGGGQVQSAESERERRNQTGTVKYSSEVFKENW